MTPTRRPRVKICCIASREEAWMASEHGAAAVGLVSRMPSGPGVISEAQIAAIAAGVPPGVLSVLLTCLQDATEIAAQQRRLATGAVQVCDRLSAGAHRALRAALPGIRILQVVHVAGPASVDEALAVAPEVDGLLLDSGNPDRAVKELGGTGRRHDWSLSRRIREASPVPIYLAGGLTAANAAEAIETVGPFGLDVCTGVRSGGKLDPARLEAFFRAIG